MNTLEIKSKKIFLQYASCVEELSPSQFTHMMKLLLMQQAGEISIHDFRVLFVMHLLSVRKSYRYYLLSQAEKDLVNDGVNQLAKSLDSFYSDAEEDGKLIKRLDLNFIKQMLPQIKNLYGPDDALTNVSFFEYKEAFRAYSSFIKTSDEEDLNELIAILYRPRPALYAIRKRFADSDIPSRIAFMPGKYGKLERRKNKIKNIPSRLKIAVYLWFGNCVNFLSTGYPNVDGNTIDLSVLFSAKPENETPGIGLTGVLFSLAESQVFGDVQKTGETNLYDVMARLYQLKTDYDSATSNSRKTNDAN